MTDSPGNIPAGTPVLVTGATGFTGAFVTRQLVEAGLCVHAIARPSSCIAALQDLDIRWFRGDVFDPETVARAADGVAYVFHLAAAYREAKTSATTYTKVHVTSTQLLARAVAGRNGFQRFVHVSTVGVHGHIAHPPADEASPFHPGDDYQRTKAEAELWLRDFAAANRLPCTVVRPCGIYGPGDRRLLKVFRMAARGWLLVLGGGKCLYHLIHVEDLARILPLAAAHPAVLNDVIIAGNAEPISLMRMAEIVAVHLGRARLRVIRLPAWPFFVAGALCEAVCRPLGIEPPLYRRRVAFYTKDRAFDTSKLRAKLGYECAYTNETGLRQTAQWYAEQGWFRGRRGGKRGCDPRDSAGGQQT